MGVMDDILATRVPSGQLAAWWLGQAGFAYKNSQGAILFVDPYLSDSCATIYGPGCTRLMPVPIAPTEARVQLVAATHQHEDHTDPLTLPQLLAANPDALFLGPASAVAEASKLGIPEAQLHTLARGESSTGCGYTLRAGFADHTADSISLVVEAETARVAHTGDGLYNDQLVEDILRAQPAAMITVINGRAGNMTASDAAGLAAQVGAPVVVPCHYGMFRGNTVDPAIFLDAMRALGLEKRVLLPTPGSPLWFPGRGAGAVRTD